MCKVPGGNVDESDGLCARMSPQQIIFDLHDITQGEHPISVRQLDTFRKPCRPRRIQNQTNILIDIDVLGHKIFIGRILQELFE